MLDPKELTDQCTMLVSQLLGKMVVCFKSLSIQLLVRVHCDATQHLFSEALFIEQAATAASELWTVAAGVCLQHQDLWKDPRGFQLDPLILPLPKWESLQLPLPLFSSLLFFCRRQVGGSCSCS